MDRNRLVGFSRVALLLSLLTSIGAQPLEQVAVHNQVAVGDRSMWETTMEGSLKLAARSGEEEMPPVAVTFRFREKIDQQVLAVQGSEITALRQRYLVSRALYTDPDGSQIEPSSLHGKTVTVRRRAGKVLISPRTLKINAEDRKQLADVLEVTRAPFLPDVEATVGQEWTFTDEQLRRVFSIARSGALTIQFAEVTRYAGRECARFHFLGEVELLIPGVPPGVKADLTGDIYHAVDIQRPIAMLFAGPLTVDAQIVEEGQPVTLTGKGRLAAKIQLQWQRVAGKPVSAAPR